MFARLLPAAAALALMIATAALAQEHPEEMHIHDVYARSNGSIGGSGAVFFMIHNNTETDDRLIAVSTDVAEKAELHTHIESADGVMQMTQIEGGIVLPSGEMHELARGGDHVMLMGLTRALKDGDTIALTLTFEKAGEVQIEATVDNARKPGEGGMMMDHDSMGDGHSGHDHSKMSGSDG
ncbi:MAG: copper-binding protein [Rhodobacteraceae bacterium PARR1]|nr:MAG: copper-binding protein [Rhodobacteraceae bacterium PARR1]